MDKDTQIISIEEAKKIMGEASKNYSDSEIKEVIVMLTLLSDIAIDSKISQRKETQHV